MCAVQWHRILLCHHHHHSSLEYFYHPAMVLIHLPKKTLCQQFVTALKGSDLMENAQVMRTSSLPHSYRQVQGCQFALVLSALPYYTFAPQGGTERKPSLDASASALDFPASRTLRKLCTLPFTLILICCSSTKQTNAVPN